MAVQPQRSAPPVKFQPVRNIVWAEVLKETPLFALPPYSHDTAARKAGRRYEQQVHDHFLALYPTGYIPGPWIRFGDKARKERFSWCQPDGWLIDFRRGLITIVEVKVRHTPDAWWQIRHLYEPLTKFIFGPNWKYAACEVTKWYDASVNFPERPALTPEVNMLWNGAFGVHVWRPA